MSCFIIKKLGISNLGKNGCNASCSYSLNPLYFYTLIAIGTQHESHDITNRTQQHMTVPHRTRGSIGLGSRSSLIPRLHGMHRGQCTPVHRGQCLGMRLGLGGNASGGNASLSIFLSSVTFSVMFYKLAGPMKFIANSY